MEKIRQKIACTRITDTVKELIEIPSVTGEEGALSDYIAQRLRAMGADTVRQQTVAGNRRNVIAEICGALPGRSILLTGHMDTVEAGEGWSSDPFRAVERDGRIYGRGACDMKAGIAVILHTAEICIQERQSLRGKVVIVLVCDEEAYSEGVLRAIEEGVQADFGLAAEPEYTHAVIGSCGKILIRAEARGKAAHAAEASKGINAIEEMGRFLSAMDTLHLPGAELIPPQPSTTLRVSGGSERYSMVIPDHCEALISKHTVPGETMEDVLAALKALARKLKLSAQFTFSVERPFYSSFLVDRSHKEVRRLQSIYRCITGAELPLICSSGVSDNNHWSTKGGIPSICFGPMGGGLHEADEWVDIEKLYQVLEIYVRFLLEDES